MGPTENSKQNVSVFYSIQVRKKVFTGHKVAVSIRERLFPICVQLYCTKTTGQPWAVVVKKATRECSAKNSTQV